MCIYNVLAYTTTDYEVVIRVLAGAPDRAIKRCRELAACYEQEIVSLRLIGSVKSLDESLALQRGCDPIRDGVEV